MTNNEEEKHKTNAFTYFTVLVVGILVLTGGIIFSGTSSVIAHLKDKNDLQSNPFGRVISDEEMTWFGSSEFIGRSLGIIPMAYLADKFGRKNILVLIAATYVVAFSIIAFARSIYLYCFAKLFLGISVGSAKTLTALYVFEIGHAEDRGMMVVSTELFAALGDLVANSLGSYVTIRMFMLISASFPLVFLCIFGCFMPETPPYLLLTDNYQKAYKSLKKMRSESPEAVENELKKIEEDVKCSRGGSAWDIVRNKILLKSLFIVVVINALKSFCGCQLLFIYTQQIFLAANTDFSYKLSSIIFNGALIPTAIASIWLARKLRYKVNLVVSNFGAGFFYFLLGVYFYSIEHDIGSTHKSNYPVVIVVGIGCFFMMGWAPIPSVIASELFPTHLRSSALMISRLVNFCLTFLMSKFFVQLYTFLGYFGLFWLFSAICILSIAYVVFCVPETKGKSFAEIQVLLGNGSMEGTAIYGSIPKTET